MPEPNLSDLPPELLDHISTHLTSAHSVASLNRTSKRLHAFVEKDAWRTFVKNRFPSIHPPDLSFGQDAARTLTALSRAWDRRAWVARYIEPRGDILADPGRKKIERWKRPRGQSIGFAPQIDCCETNGATWQDREEVLVFSAGAEICMRRKTAGRRNGEDIAWTIYRPPRAFEGLDDVVSLHLVQPCHNAGACEGQEIVAGTAKGNLSLLSFPRAEEQECQVKSKFTTESAPVRSSSICQPYSSGAFLAAIVGDTHLSLYPIDSTSSEIAPLTSIDITAPSNTHSTHRAWSASFISPKSLAIGLGPSSTPIQIYTLAPSGLFPSPTRTFSLENHASSSLAHSRLPSSSKSSIYPIIPLPSSSSSTARTNISAAENPLFLTGAFDGIIRLHDLRSPRDVEQAYLDPTDDSAIYSLLPRGRELVLAGTARHNLLKVFDLRLGAKAYSYVDAGSGNDDLIFGEQQQQHQQQVSLDTQPGKTEHRFRGTRQKRSSTAPVAGRDYSLFLRPSSSATYSGRGGGNNWVRRSAESSVYSLSSPGPHSPFVYAGVENAVVELAATSVRDKFPDPVLAAQQRKASWAKDALNLAMHDHTAEMMLLKQRGVREIARDDGRVGKAMRERNGLLRGLDERWEDANYM